MQSALPAAVDSALRGAGFEVIELAARGGSGTVYRGVETATDDAVAIKLLDAHVDLRRLQREADALQRVDHSAVPLVRYAHLVEGEGFLVSDWVEGRTLAAVLSGTDPLAPSHALELFGQLAEGLDAIHAAGIVHGDLSPDNILVSDRDEISLVDFGVSRSLTTETVTQLDMASGTPRYVAPEVLEAAGSQPASDQYSSAVLLYEMLTNSWPYPDSGNNVATTLHHHLHTRSVPLTEVNQWLPEYLNAPLQKALEKEPDKRFSSMAEFMKALQSPSPSKSGRWSRSLLIGAVVAAVIGVLAVFLITQLGGQDGQEPEVLVSVPTWEAGFAESAECNLLTQSGFDSEELAPGYFTGEAEKNAISSIGGVDQTSALQIGITNEYGLYGEQVLVEPGVSYLFSANISRAGEPGLMIMRIGWVGENTEPLDEESSAVLADDTSGQMTLRSEPAPADAFYGVAILENTASDGVFVADELIFARADSDCGDRLLDQ